MGVLEKITANMELIESKKFKLQKAILVMMLEWKHLEEYMDSTQHSFQECLDELQLKEKYLNSVQESAVESNKEMESIRVSIEGKIKKLDDKEREFQVFRDEQVSELDLKEKQLGLIGKSIEERIKLVELREEKLAAKQKVLEGIFKKFKVEEKQFEDIRKSVEERIEEINYKEMQLEKRCKELEFKEKELSDRAREIESMAKQIAMVNPDKARDQKRNDKARAQKRNESRSAQSALLGESYVDALVLGEVEVPLTVYVAAGKGAEKVAEASESQSKRAASSGVLAAQKRRRTLHVTDKEEGNEVQVTRVVAINKGGRNSLAQQGEAGEEDLPGGWSPKVDPEIDDKLAPAFNGTSKLHRLYDEIRPFIAKHERDSQRCTNRSSREVDRSLLLQPLHGVPTNLAEKWIVACCSKLQADFDLHFSNLKNSVCLPPSDGGKSNPFRGSTENGGTANHSTH